MLGGLTLCFYNFIFYGGSKMKRIIIVSLVVVLGLVGLSHAALTTDSDLTFVATYNNGLNADYAAGNGTATVTHGSGPDVGLSAAGTGAFTSSTPNTALTQTVGYNHSSIVNTGESVRYQAQGNMSLQAGTFVAWTKAAPFNTERMFTPAEGMIFAENGHWSSGNSITMYDQYYYSYKRDYLLQGSDAYGNMFYVNAMPTAETFDNWVFVAGSWNLSESGQLDLNIWVRPVGQASFSKGTSSYSDMTFIDLDEYAPLNIGSDYWGSRIYGGLIDDAQVYNRALSDNEVDAIFSSGLEVIPEPATLALLSLGLLLARKK